MYGLQLYKLPSDLNMHSLAVLKDDRHIGSIFCLGYSCLRLVKCIQNCLCLLLSGSRILRRLSASMSGSLVVFDLVSVGVECADRYDLSLMTSSLPQTTWCSSLALLFIIKSHAGFSAAAGHEESTRAGPQAYGGD